MFWEHKTKQNHISKKDSLIWISRPLSHGSIIQIVTWRWQETGEDKDAENCSFKKFYQEVRELLWGAAEDFGVV